MLFNSFQFLVFFPVVTVVYFILPHRFRWLHLLIASCIFYAAFIPAYLLILFFTIVIDYIAGIAIEGAGRKRRKAFLIISIVSNVLVLSVFKYYDFFIENVNQFINSIMGASPQPLPYLNIILPIGLSFHTFQAMSYTIEVYRGNQKAERHFGIYALYVMFYPQLVAGPIERPQNMLHQFHERKTLEYDNLISGLKLMLWGMFKKVVIADRLALYVNEVYNHSENYHGLTFVVGTIFFAFQIYCDFSGYSSIAIGSARVMGFTLMENFRTPYFSQSVQEFWRRWHISLSTWFRDYVYVPLGGNRVSTPRWYLNIMFTFIISGVWHGAAWTFVIWGALHGIFMVVESALSKGKHLSTSHSFWKVARTVFVFILVCFAWVFFRANSITEALYILRESVDVSTFRWSQISFAIVPESAHAVYSIDILLGWFWIVFLVIAEYAYTVRPLAQYARPVRWSAYATAVVVMLFFGVYDNNSFIYFQF